MVVGEYEVDRVWRGTVPECEGASVGVSLACARNGGRYEQRKCLRTHKGKGRAWLLAKRGI